jgi:hypothetical protein
MHLPWSCRGRNEKEWEQRIISPARPAVMKKSMGRWSCLIRNHCHYNGRVSRRRGIYRELLSRGHHHPDSSSSSKLRSVLVLVVMVLVLAGLHSLTASC